MVEQVRGEVLAEERRLDRRQETHAHLQASEQRNQQKFLTGSLRTNKSSFLKIEWTRESGGMVDTDRVVVTVHEVLDNGSEDLVKHRDAGVVQEDGEYSGEDRPVRPLPNQRLDGEHDEVLPRLDEREHAPGHGHVSFRQRLDRRPGYQHLRVRVQGREVVRLVQQLKTVPLHKRVRGALMGGGNKAKRTFFRDKPN